MHKRKKLPAFKERCSKCNVKGHFAKMCRKKNRKSEGNLKKQVHALVNDSNSDSDDEHFFKDAVNTNNDDEKLLIEIIDVYTFV